MFGNAFGIWTSGLNATVTVTGNVTGSSTGSANGHGINTTGANAAVTVVGNIAVTGIASGDVCGVRTTGGAAAVTVTGSVTGGQTGQNHGIFTSGTSSSRTNVIIGTCTATTSPSGIGSHAVYDLNGGGGWTVVGGTLIDSQQGDCAISARRFRAIPTLNTFRRYANNTGYPSGTPVTYATLDYIPNNVPTPNNVRAGTVYGNNEYTGTLAVPPAASVAAGVPVDNTTGTAAVRLQDIAAVTGAQIAAAVTNVGDQP